MIWAFNFHYPKSLIFQLTQENINQAPVFPKNNSVSGMAQWVPCCHASIETELGSLVPTCIFDLSAEEQRQDRTC